MTINPDDPWYPAETLLPATEFSHAERYTKPGVTIRLKLAAEMMKSPFIFESCPPGVDIDDEAFRWADRLIDRANRDERSDNGE